MPTGVPMLRNQRHDHDVDAGLKHDISGLRIDVNVEFGCGGDVAHLEICAAHQHDLLDFLGDVGRTLQGRGDVGQRPQRAQGDGARVMGAEGVDACNGMVGSGSDGPSRPV